jgi:hypothetical protein
MAEPLRLSISDPAYNVREIVKQMLLLEQHLLEEDKYCPDCISKHLLTIEALAEEAQCLDREQKWCKIMQPIVGKARVWGAAFASGVPVKPIGQDVRNIRKQLAPHVVSPIGAVDVEEFVGLVEDFGGISSAGGVGWKHIAMLIGGMGLLLVITQENRGAKADAMSYHRHDRMMR